MGYRGDPFVTPGRGSGSTSYVLKCERAGKELLAPQARAASRNPDLEGKVLGTKVGDFCGSSLVSGDVKCLAHCVSCLTETSEGFGVRLMGGPKKLYEVDMNELL